MFISDELVYIQMQKTGCTHIASLLGQICRGSTRGKHNSADDALQASGRHFLASVRNPWDWYLSLWSYGVHHGGGLHKRLARRSPANLFGPPYNRLRPSISARIKRELSKQPEPWRRLYRADTVANFREWLRRVHDPVHAHELGEGYARTSLPPFAGFMTYRYLYLCSSRPETLMTRTAPGDVAAVEQFDRRYCYIDHFIRLENLAEDLISSLESIISLADDQKQLIRESEPINRSGRLFAQGEYYDAECRELVAERERLLVNHFGYEPPA